jgi:hypothetical protein
MVEYAEEAFIITLTLALLISFFTVLCLLLLVERIRHSVGPPAAQYQSNLEEGQTPIPPAARSFSTQHYQSILDLPSSYFDEQGKDEEVCGICLSALAAGEAIKTIPACKHFFHGLSIVLISVECIGMMICKGRSGTCTCCCPLCRSPIGTRA